jgi:hypothetical protein
MARRHIFMKFLYLKNEKFLFFMCLRYCPHGVHSVYPRKAIGSASVSDPDWIRSHSGQWIWIWNPDPDPGGQLI